MSKESKPIFLPKLTTEYDMDKVAEVEREIMLSLTEKRGFEKPVMNIVKGRDPGKLHDFHLIRPLNGPGFHLRWAQELLRNGGKVMCMDTELGLSDESLARIKRAADELEIDVAKPKRIDHVGPMTIPKWIDSFLDMTPPVVKEHPTGEPGPMEQSEPKEWKRVRGQWQWVAKNKTGKHTLGKAVKRKHRHRKGK